MRKGHENTHWRHMSHSSAKYQRFNNGPSCKFESLLLTKNGVEERESVQKSENPLRVVMVDDDPDDIFITKALAKRSTLPIDFKGFESGNALFKYIEDNGTEVIDLILLDINMPKPCGYDIVSRLRKCSQNDEITIVMFSTSNYLHEKKLALSLGSNGFITKPTTAEEENAFFKVLAACYYDHKSTLLPSKELQRRTG